MNDARLEQVRDWAINCVALAPFADVGDFVALGHGALDVIDAYEALRTQLAEAQERETALREALERVEKDLQKPGKPGVHTYLRGNVHAPGCSACGMRKRVWNALRSARALSGEQANG